MLAVGLAVLEISLPREPSWNRACQSRDASKSQHIRMGKGLPRHVPGKQVVPVPHEALVGDVALGLALEFCSFHEARVHAVACTSGCGAAGGMVCSGCS